MSILCYFARLLQWKQQSSHSYDFVTNRFRNGCPVMYLRAGNIQPEGVKVGVICHGFPH